MRYDARLQMSSGRGRLVRTPTRCLFVPELDTDESLLDEFIHMFRSADATETDIADFVLSRSSSAPSFVAVSWAGATSASSRIRLIVRGDITVTTDLPSVPSLSGVGSSTWVEHHVPHRPAAAEITVGTGTLDFSDLRDGIVAAAGFRLLLTADVQVDNNETGGAGEAPPAEPVAPSAPPPTPTSSGTARAAPPASESVDSTPPQPPRPTPTPESPPAPEAAPKTTATSGSTPATVAADRSDDRPRSALFIGDEPASIAAPADTTSGLSRLAALNAASGAENQAPPPSGSDQAVASTVEPETAPDDRDLADTADTVVRQPPSRPSFGAADRTAADAEITLHPDTGDDPFDLSEGTPLTDARLCPEGHHNPPHLLRCRTCQRSLDPASATVTVEQPILGLAELEDGRTVELVGSVLFGRNPKPDAIESRVPDRMERLDAPASVSRSHVLIVASGWTLTAIDCGSRAGTALLAADDPDPVALEAWTPHELSGGDTLYLGGPTTIKITDVAM